MSRQSRGFCEIGAALLLSGWLVVASAEPLPEFYGFYAVDGGRLIELKKSAAEWPSFGPGVRFINFGKGAGPGAGEAYVSRMVFLRNVIDPDAKQPVTQENSWYVSTNAARNVELRGKPIPGQPEMLMLVPRVPLQEGAHTVVIATSRVANFFVNKEAVKKTLLTSQDCVDHVMAAMGGNFSWSKADARMAGQYTVVRCADSNPEVAARSTSASPGAPKNQAFRNCMSVGNGEAYCAREYPDEASSSAGTESERALAVQFADLMQRAVPETQQPYSTRTRDELGVSFSYPAEWELLDDKPVSFATISVPEKGRSLEDRTSITLTKSVQRVPLTLKEAVTAFIAGTREALADATITEPVSTKMCGVEAQTFLVTGTKDGQLRQLAFTVAVKDRLVLGALLRATPETFESVWDVYQRVKNSYTLKETSSVVQ